MTGGPMGSRNDQRGSASLLMVGILTVVALFAAAAMLIAGYAVGAHQARSTADLAALSAAAAYAEGTAGCPAAERIAQRSGARMARCERAGDLIDYVFVVEVEVTARSRVPGLPPSIRARGYAGPAEPLVAIGNLADQALGGAPP